MNEATERGGINVMRLKVGDSIEIETTDGPIKISLHKTNKSGTRATVLISAPPGVDIARSFPVLIRD